MGTTPNLDYDALARQSGAVNIDYDTLAKEAAGESAGQPRTIGQGLADLSKGFGQGALQTANAVSKLLNKIPGIGERLAPSVGIQAAEQLAQPQNAWQLAGQGIYQGAEALGAGALVPEIALGGSVLGPLSNIAGQAALGAASSAAHGGNPWIGAAIGGGGEAVAQVLRPLAQPAINSALGIGERSKRFGKNPAETILEETSSVRPSKLVPEIQSKIDTLSDQLDSIAKANADKKVSLSDALQNILDISDHLHKENYYDADPALQLLWDHITTNLGTKEPLPIEVSPETAIQLRRGIQRRVASWNEGAGSEMSLAAKQVQHTLNNSINQALPEAAQINSKIANLIEAGKRAGITGRSMGTTERLIDRLTRPTGALTSANIGEHIAGIPGAMAAIAGQEALRSPTIKLLAGRAFYAMPPVGAPVVRVVGLPLSTLGKKQWKEPE